MTYFLLAVLRPDIFVVSGLDGIKWGFIEDFGGFEVLLDGRWKVVGRRRKWGLM